MALGGAELPAIPKSAKVRPMFEPGTILALREPQSTEDKPYAYDRVYVVGQSPVQHTSNDPDSPWAQADAIGFLLRPAGDSFGPVIDRPYGEINEAYEVEEYPTNPTTGEPITPENNPRNLPSPEQIFAQESRKAKPDSRPKAPGFQDDAKTPEQVLREGTGGTRPQRKAKEKPKDE